MGFCQNKTAIYFPKTPFRSDKTPFYFCETAFYFKLFNLCCNRLRYALDEGSHLSCKLSQYACNSSFIQSSFSMQNSKSSQQFCFVEFITFLSMINSKHLWIILSLGKFWSFVANSRSILPLSAFDNKPASSFANSLMLL